ncbi:MAG: sigma-70 family RNA polymerase sigma factor [Candidatus Eremiobacteraeota bacterium]|nr:sigma-70 family RNA polymerase sigma factor [Candidatus Eremiobacteraeota bacterium]MBC5826819.1 sigma-70 family RNA polymerase sigma factor [Candidatus Eremiobacteraeota bacterium]
MKKTEAPLVLTPGDDFERLFLAEYRKVVGIAQRILGDRQRSEDVAQDVFAALHRRHAAGRPSSAWLYAAAAHTALNAARATRRRQRREASDARATSPLRTGSGLAADPHSVVEQKERRDAVRAALARLPPKAAAVLALRYGGLRYAEVAGALGVAVGQVGTLLARAEAAFRKEMGR